MSILDVIELMILVGVVFVISRPIIEGFKNGRSGNAGNMICPNCGTRGEPKQITKGSLGMEIVLWLCFIVPGLIYSVWRLTTRQPGCPSCGQTNMINVNTPNGRLLVKQFEAQ
jgi:ssDNA-binding Zn-finger/Zn-ribbon topoisomerase 1